jgi:hypothetical protein
MPDRLKLRTKGRFLEAPVLNGRPVTGVTKIEFAAGPFDLPQVTLHVLSEVVFNGKAHVRIEDVDPNVSEGDRKEFINALNAADLAARRKARDAQQALAGRPTGRGRLPESTDVAALVEELDALGWGFYRKRSST